MPLEILTTRNAVSISDTSAVNFVVAWWLFACSMKSTISLLFIKSKSSIYRFQTTG